MTDLARVCGLGFAVTAGLHHVTVQVVLPAEVLVTHLEINDDISRYQYWKIDHSYENHSYASQTVHTHIGDYFTISGGVIDLCIRVCSNRYIVVCQ